MTGEKLYLEPSADPDLDEKLLTMDTVLPLAPETGESVAYRLPWYNYVVKLPARDAKGRFYQKDALPAGAILILPGHEMLYLGEEGGLYYVINDASTFVPHDAPEQKLSPRGIIINDLSARREDGNTWLENLSHAVVLR